MSDPSEPRAGEPRVTAPIARDFVYTIRLEVAIPLTWAQILKNTGAHHYDRKCREMAECGVVNGLHNCALWNEDPECPSERTLHPVSWRDCDGMQKIMEQAHHHAFDRGAIGEICAWLRRTMEQIEARHAEIDRLTLEDHAVIVELLRVALENEDWQSWHAMIREIREKMIVRLGDVVAAGSAP